MKVLETAQEPPDHHYKTCLCIHMMRRASLHGWYRMSPASCCRRLWWQVWLPSKDQEISAGFNSWCLLFSGSVPGPLGKLSGHMNLGAYMLGTHSLDLVNDRMSFWVTGCEWKELYFRSQSSFSIAVSWLLFTLLLQPCNINCYWGSIFEPMPWMYVMRLLLRKKGCPPPCSALEQAWNKGGKIVWLFIFRCYLCVRYQFILKVIPYKELSNN